MPRALYTVTITVCGPKFANFLENVEDYSQHFPFVHLRRYSHLSRYSFWIPRFRAESQWCPQDVKSQDRDETETVNLQDRDETETFHFPKLSKRRRDVQPSRPRRDRYIPKNVSRPQCRSLKTPTGEVCHFTIFAGQIHYFLDYISASLTHYTHVHKTS